MRSLRLPFLVAALLLIIFIGGRSRWNASKKIAEPDSRERAPAGVARAPVTPAENIESARAMNLQRLAYAQGWNGAQPPALAAFRFWTERYRAAAVAARAALEPEGIVLAQARRPVLLDLIKADPRRALAVTVPAVIRAALPAAVRAELEIRVAGRGDFELLAGTPDVGSTDAPPAERRIALIDGVTFTAHPYGQRESQLAKDGASLHGVALEGHLALHESPLRVFEPGESLTGALEDPHCPVSGNAVDALAAGAGVNIGALTVAAAFGRTWEFCTNTDDMLARFAQQLEADEAGENPRVPSPGAPPPKAADVLTTHTSGPQRVLVIRVDFSDFTGAAIGASEAQGLMDSTVKSFFEEGSYGQTTLVTTVTPTVYRLPQTGSAYALGGSDTQLHADARALAAANYTLTNFDRIIVVFPNIGSSRVSGSRITFGGEGSVGGTNVWINGTFGFRLLSHELGHTYGLKHANLWQVSDGNPISPIGTSAEYKDPFDAMGDSSSSDSRFHYNPRAKNIMGWLPDSAVKTITTSGTYRVYRFDDKSAMAQTPLALRVYRDGMRWYWIGLRQNFTTNSSLSNGAYVTWGFNNLQQSQLLDLTTTGANSADAALAIGATFSDPAYGITIKPIERGGADPAQYLDIEVTVLSAPPSTVSAWGRNGAYFYDASTGALLTPTPETYLPADLTDVRTIASGDAHVLALKNDGTLVGWGDNLNGETTLPAGLSGTVAAIAAGGNVSGVVKLDGTVQLWGESLAGVTSPPAGLTGVKQLAIGGAHSGGIYHALALKTDGTVVGWGDNTRTQATPPAGLNNVVAIAASDRLSIALKADGTVVRWGTTFGGAIPFPSGLSGVAAIASSGGAAHALALKTDGTVVAWGINVNNQCDVPAGLNNVVALATGAFHSLALKSDGTVVAWGSTASGKCNVPFALPRSYAIAATNQASLALTGQHLYLLAPPQAQNVALGGTATLSVGAVGTGPLTYQWRKDGVAIAGATASTLTIFPVAATSAGNYDVVVRDGTSVLTTAPAPVAITAGPGQEVVRIANLSILSSLASRTDSFRMGFVVGGTGTTGPKRLLIRAAGPSLAALGVPGTLGDPTVTLFTGSTQVGTNDDWGGQAAISSAMAAVGAFPYVSATSLDAALVSDITGRDNTVVVGSAFGGAASGTVIAEIYDATPSATFTAFIPRLINVSVLKDIGTSLTAGFVIGGPAGGTKKVLIRAVGPGLAVVGVTSGFVLDPKLTLFGTSQAIVGQNDDWGGTAELTAAFNSVGAFALPATSKDAALTATLQPGVNYSAVVAGANGGTGLVLVEVYEVP